MQNFNAIFELYKEIEAVEKDKINSIKKYDFSLHYYRKQIIDLISKTNTQYDFYQSFKHYTQMSKDTNYFNIYYKINNRYMPIITDICILGQDLELHDYDDYNKIATGSLSNVTIYCDNPNTENFMKSSVQDHTKGRIFEDFDFD